MLRSPFGKWLRDWRRSIIGWTLAIAAVGGMYAAFWPTFDKPEIKDLIAVYPQAIMEALNFTDIQNAAAYLTATVFGLVVGTLIAVYAVAAGTRTIAGDEEAGTLELILAHPVSRARLALRRFSAFLASATLIVAGLLLVLLAETGLVHLDGISLGQFAAMHVHLLLFAAFYGAVGFAVGAATGRRAAGLGAGAAVIVFGFVANGLLPQIRGFEWTRTLSPYHWLVDGRPLANGLQIGHVMLMAGLTIVLVAAGTWFFDRRDVQSV
ncbi:MAG: ABC transporter permease subunit [Acidimicrobiia bacterium]